MAKKRHVLDFGENTGDKVRTSGQGVTPSRQGVHVIKTPVICFEFEHGKGVGRAICSYEHDAGHQPCATAVDGRCTGCVVLILGE